MGSGVGDVPKPGAAPSLALCCCLASVGSFLAIISRRQRWRILGLVHEARHSRDPADRELSRLLAKETPARDAFLTLARAVG